MMRRLPYALALLFAAAACDEPAPALWTLPDASEAPDVREDASADLTDVSDATDDASTDADTNRADAAPPACNGHVALCDRPFDEVVFAGTHNSMASDEDGFLAPNHNWGIARQLEDGVRAMLIDTYRDDDGLALCHGSCLFGRLDAIEQLSGIADFLRDNPQEVMAFIFQDGVSMEDSLTLFEESGLGALAITPPAAGEPWPTLSELIAADTRALLTHESGNSGPEWFPRAWDVFVDTPYSFSSVDDFSCAQNRGPADAPLRLLNHWLGAPLPSPALGEEANRYETLQARAEACTVEWGRPPTIVAVDFYDLGAVFDVVDELNGVASVR